MIPIKTYFKRIGIVLLYLLTVIISQVAVTIAMAIYFVVKIIIGSSAENKGQAAPAIDFEQLMKQASDLLLDNTNLLVAISGVLLVAGFIFVFKLMKRKTSEEAGITKITMSSALLSALAGLCAGIFISIILTLTSEISALDKYFEAYEELSGLISGGGNIFVSIICVGILAPFAEEFMFRGLIMNQLKKVMPVFWAVVLQAVMFGVYHFNFVQSTYAALLGLLLGVLCIFTKSLWSSVIAHVVINSSSLLISDVESMIFSNLTAMIIMSVVCVAGLVYGLTVLYRKAYISL